MPSILLSFVGKQDPFSDKNHTEGSIVSLVKHLLQQQQVIKRVILLYTEETAMGALDTQTWLSTELALDPERIRLVPVERGLSEDPVNLLLAAQAARSAILDEARAYLAPEDCLEFNASSGTPVMKSAWSLLQAAGYAPRSRVWQVRDPQQMRSHQERVSQMDVTPLRDEFDCMVIRQQIQDYNYRGALISLQGSHLQTPIALALLEYGYYRQVRDFDRAFNALVPVRNAVDPVWFQEIATLRQKEMTAILRDAYFQTLILLQLGRYAEFLVALSGLHENLIRFLVTNRAGLVISTKYGDRADAWATIRQFDQGNLYRFLQGYRLPSGVPLRVGPEEAIARLTLIAILDYFPDFREVVSAIKAINDYCDRRNEVVHQLAGVSAIEDAETLLANLRRAMQFVVSLAAGNPFDRLNQQVCALLEQAVASV